MYFLSVVWSRLALPKDKDPFDKIIDSAVIRNDDMIKSLENNFNAIFYHPDCRKCYMHKKTLQRYETDNSQKKLRSKKIYPTNGSQGILLRLIFCRILVYFVTNKYIKCTRDREALCSASEFRSDSNVRMAAIAKLDNKILNVCSIGDLPAREARYGKSC